MVYPLKSLAFVLSVLLSILSVGCAAEGECQVPNDCGSVDEVCDQCAPVGEQLCIEETCVAPAALEFNIRGDVSLARAIDDQSASFVHTVFDSRDGDCSTLVNALSVGFKNVSGGSFHPDIVLGRAPAGEVFVEVQAYDDDTGSGTLLGTGCIGPISVDADLVLPEAIIVAEE